MNIKKNLAHINSSNLTRESGMKSVCSGLTCGVPRSIVNQEAGIFSWVFHNVYRKMLRQYLKTGHCRIPIHHTQPNIPNTRITNAVNELKQRYA
jgi:hypothetical protein